MSDNQQPATVSGASGVTGTTYHQIDGWLIIPAYWQPALRIAADIYLTYQTVMLYATLTTAHMRITPASQAYTAILLAITIGIAVAWAICAYLAWSIRPVFPKAYIWTSTADVVSSLLLMGAGYTLRDIPPEPDVGILAAAVIWIPYMLVSKRVKATFDGVPMPPTTTR